MHRQALAIDASHLHKSRLGNPTSPQCIHNKILGGVEGARTHLMLAAVHLQHSFSSSSLIKFPITSRWRVNTYSCMADHEAQRQDFVSRCLQPKASRSHPCAALPTAMQSRRQVASALSQELWINQPRPCTTPRDASRCLWYSSRPAC